MARRTDQKDIYCMSLSPTKTMNERRVRGERWERDRKRGSHAVKKKRIEIKPKRSAERDIRQRNTRF